MLLTSLLTFHYSCYWLVTPSYGLNSIGMYVWYRYVLVNPTINLLFAPSYPSWYMTVLDYHECWHKVYLDSAITMILLIQNEVNMYWLSLTANPIDTFMLIICRMVYCILLGLTCMCDRYVSYYILIDMLIICYIYLYRVLVTATTQKSG